VTNRLKLLAIAAVVSLSFGLTVSAASSPSLTLFADSGAVVQVLPEIDGTPCWDAGEYVVAPEGVTFDECTAPTVPPTTTSPPATTVPPTTQPPPTTTEPPITTTPPADVQFVESFDTEASLDRFDYQVHHAWTANSTKAAWPGDHDTSCGGAGTLRQVNNPTAIDGQTHYPGMGPDVGVVYWCQPAGADAHMMTSFNTSHYAQVNFAPKPTFNDVNKVCWDQNRTNLGSRHWTQLVVVPLDTFAANGDRLDYVASRFSPTGPGKYGIHPRDETLLVEFGRGKPRVQIGQSVQDINGLAWSAGSDKAARYEHCVENTASGIRVTIDGGTGPIAYNYQGSLPSGDVRVILQQDLYNPDKAPGTPNAYTWHWDNIIVDTD
jgi:hypothetical protein